jgi:peroxiredoxin Q/BCP
MGRCDIMSLNVGDRAPDFSLMDQNGDEFHLSEEMGKVTLVIYFYPKDNTSGCTAQACAFRDQYQDFKDAGAEVVGISSDTIQKHSLFIGQYSLPFRLLSDEKGKVRELFGVPRTMGIIPGRVTYVIDKEGTVKYIFNSQSRIKEHVSRTLEIIKGL